MTKLEKRVTLTEDTAETIKTANLTFGKETGPWILVEAEIDITYPARPASGAIARVAAGIGTTKAVPTDIYMNQSGMSTTKKMYRAVGDQICIEGPDIWRGADPLQLDGEYYYAYYAVLSAGQATPTAQTMSAKLTFVTPDELGA